MDSTFKHWLSNNDVVNEAGGFLGKVGKSLANIFSDQISQDKIIAAIDGFPKFLKSHYGLSLNVNDPKVKKSLMNMIKVSANNPEKGTNPEISPKALIDLADAMNSVNQHKVTPLDVARLYGKANDINPKLFPFYTNDPHIIPSDIQNGSAWQRHIQANTKSTNNLHTPHVNAKEGAAIKGVVDQFMLTSGFNPTTQQARDLLSNFIGILYLRKTGPWESMFKRIYTMYKASGGKSSALEFIQNLTHEYDIGRNNEVEAVAQKIDSSAPQPQPQQNNQQNVPLTKIEKELEKHLSWVPKRSIYAVYTQEWKNTPPTEKLSMADFKQIKPYTDEWNRIIKAYNAIQRSPQAKIEFTNLMSKYASLNP